MFLFAQLLSMCSFQPITCVIFHFSNFPTVGPIKEIIYTTDYYIQSHHMTLTDGFNLIWTLIYFKSREDWRKEKGTNQPVFQGVWEIIEWNCTSLILTVSWVLTSGVAASTLILSSVTLSVFVAVTDSPGVTLKLQCTIRYPASVPSSSQAEWQPSQITPLKSSMSHSPGSPPMEFMLCPLGQKLFQWPRNPFNLIANYITPTALVPLLTLLWLHSVRNKELEQFIK